MIDADIGGVLLVLQLLTLLHESTIGFDSGGDDGSIIDVEHNGLNASGSGFITGNATDVGRFICASGVIT